MIFLLILEYLLLAYINFKLLIYNNIHFKNEKHEDVNIGEDERLMIYFVMSIFWIIYLPKMYFTTKIERNNK